MSTMSTHVESDRTPVGRGIGLPGRLVVGGAVSTGLLLGGYVVAAMTLAGRMNGNALILTSLGLFIVGAVVGLVVSAVVGLVGHDAEDSWREAFRQVGMGALYAVPACLVGAVLAGWIGMAVMALYVARVAPVALTVVAALVGFVVMAATFEVTCDVARNVFRRIRRR